MLIAFAFTAAANSTCKFTFYKVLSVRVKYFANLSDFQVTSGIWFVDHFWILLMNLQLEIRKSWYSYEFLNPNSWKKTVNCELCGECCVTSRERFTGESLAGLLCAEWLCRAQRREWSAEREREKRERRSEWSVAESRVQKVPLWILLSFLYLQAARIQPSRRTAETLAARRWLSSRESRMSACRDARRSALFSQRSLYSTLFYSSFTIHFYIRIRSVFRGEADHLRDELLSLHAALLLLRTLRCRLRFYSSILISIRSHLFLFLFTRIRRGFSGRTNYFSINSVIHFGKFVKP